MSNHITDKHYWETFYNKSNLTQECSDFSKFVIDYFNNNNNNNNNKIINVLDCGCGNGRDSYKLSTKYKVLGIDNNGYIPSNIENVQFINDDFITKEKSNFDLIYSRFTFHSITNEQQVIFLDSIKLNTYLAIETRSDISKNITEYYGKTHFRNYTNKDYLEKLLIKKNFKIYYIKEDIDMAIYKNENPVCIRVICKKL